MVMLIVADKETVIPSVASGITVKYLVAGHETVIE
jgi:hypothetical protein